jgi:hypothetical protein
MKVAEALLRRKELTQKVETMRPITQADLFTRKVKRINITDSTDEVTIDEPKLVLSEVFAEFNYYCKCLRLIDAAIQQSNWTADIITDFDGLNVNEDYVAQTTGVTKTLGGVVHKD